MSTLRVCKFGGTSLATAEQMRKVAAIIDADARRRVVVPSAPGKAHPKDTKITDLLYLAADMVAKGQPMGGVWETIAGRYLQIACDLGLKLDLRRHLDEVRDRIAGGAGAHYAASRGEYLNGLIMADLLKATFVDAADVIVFTRGNQVDEATYGRIAKACSGPGRYVVPGFYGRDADGNVRTFSRGGSDITGSIVAAGLDTAVYENWTDVSGVLMTDPRVVPEAKPISEVTYRELRELSYMGASVLHEEAVFPVRQRGIPINIRNTNDPTAPGTMIVAQRDPKDQVVVGIAGTAGFSVFDLSKALMNNEIGFDRRVCSVFERLGISIEHTPSSIDTMSVVVADAAIKGREDEILADLKAAVQPDTCDVQRGLALVATVGLGMCRHVGVAARLFTALARAKVNVRMIDQGSSEQNIIVGVEDGDLKTAIRAIYDEFAKP